MDAPDAIAERISDPDLRKHALEGGDEPVSVVIELALPQGEIEYEQNQVRGEPPRPQGAASPPGQEGEEIEDAAEKFLEQLLGEPPVHLRSLNMFIATANGGQLREIAQRPFVKSIAPNRTLRS